MAWELLPVDYTDAVWSGLKKYTEITNDDGTVSFIPNEKIFIAALVAILALAAYLTVYLMLTKKEKKNG